MSIFKKFKDRVENKDNLEGYEKADNFMSLEPGTILQKGSEKYLLIKWDIICGGNSKQFRLIRFYEEYNPLFFFVKEVYDSEINEYFIIRKVTY